jgi:sulfate adenylyltransferase large subunit
MTTEAVIEQSEERGELLRFLTCGSVDDGKSTLIGRLLFDSKQIFEDQLEALERASHLRGEGEINLANLTDGLQREREQGITIDVAYRYFATPKRKFIVADTPGHVQYTRNMVTGASTANLALILIDARKGVIEQTRRHAYLASLLGIPHMILCVNKMDLVDYSQDVYDKIVSDFADFATHLEVRDLNFIPISALVGDNVVARSEATPWYDGAPLLSMLETVHIANDQNFRLPRFPVQYVIRPYMDEYHDYRGYAGEVASGVFRPGDSIVALPSGKRSTIKEINTLDGPLDCAYPPMSVTILLNDDIDVSRGDLICLEGRFPHVSSDIDAMVCWMHEQPMVPGKRYVIKHNTHSTRGMIKELVYRVDIEDTEQLDVSAADGPGEVGEPDTNLKKDFEAKGLGLNGIGRVKIRTQKPLMYDAYRRNRKAGSFIIIDETTNVTVGAGMIREPDNPPPPPAIYDDYVI